MATYQNKYDIRKTRYTHRDYNSIKEDLISIIPSLTQEWTGREESDPGIVLIKLMAMFGDTLSYNVDKIALELYIQSVTQRKNCAKILSLLGYKMHWYRSARVMANVRLVSIYDRGSNLVHTLITPFKATFKAKNSNIQYCVANQGRGLEQIDIYSSTTSVPIKLVQGSPAVDTFYGKDLINNRYYFRSPNVDESELYLEVTEAGRNVNCKLTENLNLQTDSSAIYFEFNVDDYDRPYIQLDEIWEDLVNSENPKFMIHYILSRGSEGNVTYDVFSKIDNVDEGTTTTNLVISNLPSRELSNDGVRLDTYNRSGKDPLTVIESKKDSSNYVFTHDTLVTSSDYEKAAKRIDGVTVSKLVDVQVIYNDHLDLNDICNRGIDKFSSQVIDLMTADIVLGQDRRATLVMTGDKGIVSPKYGDYVKVKFNEDINNFETGHEVYNSPQLVSNIQLSIVCLLTLPDSGDGDKVFPVNKTFDSDSLIAGKEYIIRFSPLKVEYNRTTYGGRWDLYDDADQVTKEHTHLEHHKVILYLGYYNFNPEYNIYYNSTFDDVVGAKSHYQLRGSDPYGVSYNDTGDKINNGPDGCGFYPYKPVGNLQYAMRDLINNLHVVTNEVDFGTLKLFPFKVKGILHLIEPKAPAEVLDILNTIDSSLELAYYPDRHKTGEKPNFIELVDIIQKSDPRIKYFDATDKIVEWAPAIQADPEKSDQSNYIDKIFDTTSAIFYNGLSDKFVLDDKFFTFRIKNTGDLTNYLSGQNNLSGLNQPRVTSQDAYLVNYSRLKYDNPYKVDKITYGHTVTIKVNNIAELRALVNDMRFSGNVTLYDEVIEQGETQYISRGIIFVSNLGLRWVE